MKKIIAIALAVIMLFGLSGCAGNFTPNKLVLNQPSNYDVGKVEITDSDKIAEAWDYYVNLEYDGTTKEIDTNESINVSFENTETQEYESFIVFSSGLVWFDENAEDEEVEYYCAVNGSEVYDVFVELLNENDTSEE